MLEWKAMWWAHVIRQGGLPDAVTDGLPMGTSRGRGHPKLRWIDNVQELLRIAEIEREQVMAANPGMHPSTI